MCIITNAWLSGLLARLECRRCFYHLQTFHKTPGQDHQHHPLLSLPAFPEIFNSA